MGVWSLVDPFTLGAVGAVALTEGIKFLYGQAGDVLRRWRERKDAAAEASSAQPPPSATEPVKLELPRAAFEGQLRDPKLHFDAIERLEADLRDLRAAVADYAQDIDEVDPSDTRLLQAVDGLRRAMEAVYGQRIAFKGEPGLASGPTVTGEVKVNEVLGYVAGLRAGRILSGSAVGRVEAEKVGPEAEAIGVETDTIG
jgi:hypothetical protein